MATLKVDRDRLPYLEDLALTLENEVEFYKKYVTLNEALRARDLISNWKHKTAAARGWDKDADKTTADEREFLRRYFNQKWGVNQPVGSGSREQYDGPGFYIGDGPPTEIKAEATELATDWYSLPDGTTLITQGGSRYVKSRHKPYMAADADKGFVVGENSAGGWNRWNKDGKSCNDRGVVYDETPSYHLVSYELPVKHDPKAEKPVGVDPALLRFKQTKPIDYSQLPEGTRLFTKGGGEYIKGRPPEDLEGLTEAMRKPSFYVNSSGSGRPVYGYQARDGKFIGWQNWKADGTLGSVSTNVRELELTGYDTTPSGGLMPATNRDDRVDAIRHAIEVIENSHHSAAHFEATQPQPQPKEITMNAIIDITTKTLINGQDIANYSNAQLYEIIAQQEKKLAELDAIKNKPKALKKELADRQAGIDALVAHLDARDDGGAK